MIAKLKEYKELITILVFFLGGFFWLDNRFSTKSDLKQEIAALNCMLEKYMMLTQQQIRVQSLEKELYESNSHLTAMLSIDSVELSPAMKFELTQIKEVIGHKRSELLKSQASIQSICDELQRNECRKAVK